MNKLFYKSIAIGFVILWAQGGAVASNDLIDELWGKIFINVILSCGYNDLPDEKIPTENQTGSLLERFKFQQSQRVGSRIKDHPAHEERQSEDKTGRKQMASNISLTCKEFNKILKVTVNFNEWLQALIEESHATDCIYQYLEVQKSCKFSELKRELPPFQGPISWMQLYLSGSLIGSKPEFVKQYLALELKLHKEQWMPKKIATRRLPNGRVDRSTARWTPFALTKNSHIRILPRNFPHHLRELNLSQNRIISLPSEISLLTSLEVLILNNNRLSKLPEEISTLTTLRELNLAHNRLWRVVLIQQVVKRKRKTKLSGFGACKSFTWSYEQPTPESLNALVSLQSLYLDGNGLFIVPESISALTNLRLLSFTDNSVKVMPEWLMKRDSSLKVKLEGNPCSNRQEQT